MAYFRVSNPQVPGQFFLILANDANTAKNSVNAWVALNEWAAGPVVYNPTSSAPFTTDQTSAQTSDRATATNLVPADRYIQTDASGQPVEGSKPLSQMDYAGILDAVQTSNTSSSASEAALAQFRIEQAGGAEQAPPLTGAGSFSGDVGMPTLSEAEGGRYAPGAAFERAMQQIGMTGGLRRAGGLRARYPLRSIFEIGRQAGLQFDDQAGTELGARFQGLQPGTELKDFYTQNLPLAFARGNLATGNQPSLARMSQQILNLDPTLGTSLAGVAGFFDPQFGVKRGEAGAGGYSGDDAADMLANIALTAAGRKYGALSGALPSREHLIESYGARPVGEPAMTFRDYLVDMLRLE